MNVDTEEPAAYENTPEIAVFSKRAQLMGKEVSATRNRLEKAFGYVPETPWAAYIQQQDAKLRRFAPSSVLDDDPIKPLGRMSTMPTGGSFLNIQPQTSPFVSTASKATSVTEPWGISEHQPTSFYSYTHSYRKSKRTDSYRSMERMHRRLSINRSGNRST